MFYLTTNDFSKPQYVLPSGDIQEGFCGFDDEKSAVVAMHRRLEKVIEHARLNGGLEHLPWESLTFHLHDGTDKTPVPFVHSSAYLPRYEYLLKDNGTTPS